MENMLQVTLLVLGIYFSFQAKYNEPNQDVIPHFSLKPQFLTTAG